ncbi:hypothetical protein BJF81_07545 [Ornithinimicrobium sp. CNJ-824]|nr:hypothetical protein BJF81_07545 [Ornithinimicrobium sp. CNJ-824]
MTCGNAVISTIGESNPHAMAGLPGCGVAITWVRSLHDRGQFARRVAGVDNSTWLQQEGPDLSVRTGAVLDATGHHEKLSWAEDDVSVTELDRELSVDHEEQFVGVLMGVPDEVTLDLDQLDLVVVDPGDQLRGPVVGEPIELLAEVHDVVTHGHCPSPSGEEMSQGRVDEDRTASPATGSAPVVVGGSDRGELDGDDLRGHRQRVGGARVAGRKALRISASGWIAPTDFRANASASSRPS